MGNTCESCRMYRNAYCSAWKVRIADLAVAETCQKFSAKPISETTTSRKVKSDEKPMNKGLMIRQKKLDKQRKRRNTIKPSQENLIRFVSFKVKVIERINGQYRHPERTEFGNGLQIKNKIYTPDGHYKFVNRSTLKITRIYETIPDWANQELLDRYYKATTGSNL